MSEQRTSTIKVAVIGSQTSRVTEFVNLLRRNSEFQIVGEFFTIAGAFAAGLGATLPSEMVIVLQSLSSEYAPDDVNRLIGRMFNARIFCCYGPWCESDGRTHEIWPIAMRVPLSSANAVITEELAAMRNRLPPQSPMSAGEEVFAHRLSRSRSLTVENRRTLVVVSSEVPLRSLAERIGVDAGLKTFHCECDMAAAENVLSGLPHTDKVLVLVDLDPCDANCLSLLETLASDWPRAIVLGMSVFSQESFPELPAVEIILQKIELYSQLLGQLPQSSLMRT